MRLDAVVRNRYQISWNQARGWIETGKIWLNGVAVMDPATPTEESAEIELKMNAPKPSSTRAQASPQLAKSDVIYLDSQLIVVNKPAGLSSVPYEKTDVALEQLINKHLGSRITVVQRLDRETSGLLVFARTKEAGMALGDQFRHHTVIRRYVALVQGYVTSQTIRSKLLENRGDGLRGSLKAGSPLSRDLAKPAVTHVRMLNHNDEMTLIECRLETGRTHQIRIHLSEAGHPLLGEKAYIREYTGTKVEAPRLMLHAAELGFDHPTTKAPMHWTMPPPKDFLALLPAGWQQLAGG